MNRKLIKINKSLLIFFFLTAFAVPLFAQPLSRPWWLDLEQGKLKFRGGDYGGALMLFEDARRQRRAMYEQMERDLINFLSTREARLIGDSLEIIERFTSDRYYTSVTAALEELYYRVPRASLNNSANAALTAIGKLKDYPEAEYWIGEIYRVEGELILALSQYRRAYAMRELLEDSGFSVTLQYKISDILRIRQEYNEMERVLLSIIGDIDTLWANAEIRENAPAVASEGRGTTPVPYAQSSASFARTAMTRTLENDGINRFLELYRYNNGAVEQAHRLLGFYYAVSGRPSAQQHLMFAFLIQNTIIIEELRRRQFDFVFTDLQSLAVEINKNPLLLSYINEVEYFKTIYYLGASLYRNGRTTVARSFWSFLASQPQAGEWQARSVVQLRSPQLEPVVEMP
jgi:tetratricopeptide (TPR) repeat protein